MPNPERIAAHIQKIRELPEQLAAAVSGLTDEQLDTPYGDGKWTVRQVAHHLADSHMNGYIRMKLTLLEDNPTLKTYEQTDWAEAPDARAGSIDCSLRLLDGLHVRWVRMLEALSPEDCSRTANHPEQGPVALGVFLKIYADHCVNHVKQITDLRAAKGW